MSTVDEFLATLDQPQAAPTVKKPKMSVDDFLASLQDVSTPQQQLPQEPTVKPLPEDANIFRRGVAKLGDIGRAVGGEASRIPRLQEPGTDAGEFGRIEQELGPAAALGTQIGAAGATAFSGILGLITDVPDRIINPERFAAKGEEEKGLFENLQEMGRDVSQMLLNLPAQLDYMAGQVTGSPTFGTGGLNEDNPLLIALSSLSGKTPQQYYDDATQSLFESAGVDPIFALEMMKIPAKVGKKVSGKLKGGKTVVEQVKGKPFGNLLAEITEIEKAQKGIISNPLMEKWATKDVLRAVDNSRASQIARMSPEDLRRSFGEGPKPEPPTAPLPKKTGFVADPQKIRGGPEVDPRTFVSGEELGSVSTGIKGSGGIIKGLDPTQIIGSSVATGATVLTAMELINDEETNIIEAGLGAAGLLGIVTGKGKVKAKGGLVKGSKVKLFVGARPKFKIPNTPSGVIARSSMAEAYAKFKLNASKAMVTMEEATKPFAGVRGVAGKVKGLATGVQERSWLKKNMKKAIESPETVTAPTQNVQNFLDAWRSVADDVATQLEGIGQKTHDGRSFKRIKNFFPDVITENTRNALTAKSGDLYDALKTEFEVRGIDVNLFQQTMTDQFPVKKFGSADYNRIANFPDVIEVNGKKVKVLETDPFKIIPNYINEASRRISIAETFGTKNPTGKANDIFRGLMKESGSEAANAFRDMWEDLNGFPVDKINKNDRYFKAFRGLETIARTGQLSGATVANMFGGFLPVVTRNSMKNSVKGFFNTFRPSRRANINELRRLGAYSNDVLSDLYYTADFTGATGAASKNALKAVGFNAINKHINKVSGGAAKMDFMEGIETIKRGDGGKIRRLWGGTSKQLQDRWKRFYDFTDLDIKRMVETGPTEADLARVVQTMVSATNVAGETGMTRSRIFSKDWMRRVTAYSSYARTMGNVGADVVWEAKQGNVAPLLKLAIGAPISGEMIIAAKNWLLDREREDSSIYSRLFHDIVYAGGLGLLGEVAQRAEWSFVNSNGDVTLLDVTPPTFSTYTNLLTAIVKAKDPLFDGDWEEAVEILNKKALQKSVPLFRIMARQYGKNWGGLSYIADRTKYGIYTTEGKDHLAGQAIPDKFPNTVDMLTSRISQPEKEIVLDLVRAGKQPR